MDLSRTREAVQEHLEFPVTVVTTNHSTANRRWGWGTMGTHTQSGGPRLKVRCWQDCAPSAGSRAGSAMLSQLPRPVASLCCLSSVVTLLPVSLSKLPRPFSNASRVHLKNAG